MFQFLAYGNICWCQIGFVFDRHSIAVGEILAGMVGIDINITPRFYALHGEIYLIGFGNRMVRIIKRGPCYRSTKKDIVIIPLHIDNRSS